MLIIIGLILLVMFITFLLFLWLDKEYKKMNKELDELIKIRNDEEYNHLQLIGIDKIKPEK